MQSFLRVTVTPLPPKSVASGVYTAFPQITQKILITDTCHWLEPITVILGFWKYLLLKKQSHRTIIFSQSPRFQFSSPILDGLSVFFNAHHFFMRKQFMCVDCYTGRLTFSNIILHKRAIRWILVASQAEMRKDECAPEVVAYEWNLIVINYWRKTLSFIQEFGSQIRPSSPILGPSSKGFQGFHPWIPLRVLRVTGWLAHWFHVSPHLIFKSWHLCIWNICNAIYTSFITYDWLLTFQVQ